jgi:hypothetical protein
MRVTNDKAASAPGGHQWTPGDTVEVPDDLGGVLLSIKDGGFYQPNTADSVVMSEIDPADSYSEVDPEAAVETRPRAKKPIAPKATSN